MERANPARWLRQCPAPGAITAQALAKRPHARVADPGLIVEDPEPDQEAIPGERDWNAAQCEPGDRHDLFASKPWNTLGAP